MKNNESNWKIIFPALIIVISGISAVTGYSEYDVFIFMGSHPDLSYLGAFSRIWSPIQKGDKGIMRGNAQCVKAYQHLICRKVIM